MRLLILLFLFSCSSGVQKAEFDESKVIAELEKSSPELKGLNELKSVGETEAPVTKLGPKTATPKQVNSAKKKLAAVKKTAKLPAGKPKDPIDTEVNKELKHTLASWRKPIVPGEKVLFEVTYLGITAGYAKLSVLGTQNYRGKEVFHFYGKLWSAPYYKMIYQVDDYIESFAYRTDLRPIKYLFVQRETKKSSQDMQFFDFKKQKIYFRYFRQKNDEVKKVIEDRHIPPFTLDALSSLYFLRGLDFSKSGAKYVVPVVIRGKLHKVTLKKTGVRTLDTPLGRKKTYVVEATDQEWAKDKKPKGTAKLWFLQDYPYNLARFQVDLKFGTLKGFWRAGDDQ